MLVGGNLFTNGMYCRCDSNLICSLAPKNEHSAGESFCAAVRNTSYHEQDERLSTQESNTLNVGNFWQLSTHFFTISLYVGRDKSYKTVKVLAVNSNCEQWPTRILLKKMMLEIVSTVSKFDSCIGNKSSCAWYDASCTPHFPFQNVLFYSLWKWNDILLFTPHLWSDFLKLWSFMQPMKNRQQLTIQKQCVVNGV